jgi:hypothetical protein
MSESASESATTEKIAVRDLIWIVVLVLPSLYVLFTLPPLWRDTDGFNEIASTFAPKGIIHWLPGYCFVGRLLMILAGAVGSLVSGHGLPYLSIGTPELSDIGIYSLLVVQHLFLIYSLFFVVRTVTNLFFLRLLFAFFFALTPWLYLFAQCIGTEAFSNPLVCLIAGYGWICVRTPDLQLRRLILFFLLLLAAALTRHINLGLICLVPIALVVPAIIGTFFPNKTFPQTQASRDFRGWRKLFVYGCLGFGITIASIGVQQTMCWLFRVPYRSTFGVTFEWRLDYLNPLPADQRNTILGRVSAKVNDPIVTEAIRDLIQAMDRNEKRGYGFLYDRMDEILSQSGPTSLQQHTFEIDSKLNRVAQAFLTPPDPALLSTIKNEMLRIPFLTQADMAAQPLTLTDSLQREMAAPRYARLRPLGSFQFSQGHYQQIFQRNAYFQLFNNVPFGVLALLSLAGGILVLWISPRNFLNLTGVGYAWSMVVTGFLLALGNCFSTSFGARYYLPLYSLAQISVMLLTSLFFQTRPRSKSVPLLDARLERSDQTVGGQSRSDAKNKDPADQNCSLLRMLDRIQPSN